MRPVPPYKWSYVGVACSKLPQTKTLISHPRLMQCQKQSFCCHDIKCHAHCKAYPCKITSFPANCRSSHKSAIPGTTLPKAQPMLTCITLSDSWAHVELSRPSQQGLQLIRGGHPRQGHRKETQNPEQAGREQWSCLCWFAGASSCNMLA